ncbi:hypothetical protein [Brevundimonas sp.]|uniref:hypothetical protein n=1 Tax=Brevundimonas sp. TaxID=1871086 RepID=UPI00286B28A2|nr:hypothetical protein [Brevundimonas sp.]
MRRNVAAYLDESRSLKLAQWTARGERADTMCDDDLVEAARFGLVVTGVLSQDQARSAYLVVEEAVDLPTED